MVESSNLPGMNKHVEDEAPYFESLVWAIDEDAASRNRAGGSQWLRADGVIDKGADLKWNRPVQLSQTLDCFNYQNIS